jgi:hypothetical protein
MAHAGVIGHHRRGPVAESVDAGAVQCSLSWFKSRPGLQPTLLRSFGWASQPVAGTGPNLQADLSRHSPQGDGGKLPVDGAVKTLSRVRNLV